MTRVTCVTDLCVTVGHWSLSHIKPCLNHIVVVSNQLWDQFDLSTPVTAVLSPYIKPCCDQSPEQGRHPNVPLEYFRCEFCQGAMSTIRQDGPSTGLVAAAVLFVAFAAKDLFSETTPGED